MQALNKLSYCEIVKNSIIKEEKLKRLKYIEYLTTPNKLFNNTLPIFNKKHRSILYDKDLYRILFTKYPTIVNNIKFMFPYQIRDDEEFMIELYHLTKCRNIISSITKPETLIALLPFDLNFINSCYYEVIYNVKLMRELIKKYPILISYKSIPEHIRYNYKMVKDAIQDINSIKTFLMSMKKEGVLSYLNGIEGIRKNICDYLRVIPYELQQTNYYTIPFNLHQKCKTKHNCSNCSKLKPIKYWKVFEIHKELRIMPCKHPAICTNCPNFDERRQWIQIIREISFSYGFQII